MKLNLLISQVKDTIVRENFQRIFNYLGGNPPVQADLEFLTFIVPTPGTTVTNFTVAHNLGYTPKDILVSSIIGNGTITWNYASFDSTNLNLSIAGATAGQQVAVRVLVGSLN
jgi:hypothetical protein